MANEMSSKEMRDRAANSIREATDGKGASRLFGILNNPERDLRIAPPKPDPETMVNSSINESVNARPPLPLEQDQSVDIQRMIAERAGQKINPETGMPFFSAPDAQQSNPEEEMKRQLKLEYLKKMSQGQ